MDLYPVEESRPDLRLPIFYHKLDSGFDIRHSFYSNPGLYIASCTGCYGSPNDYHGLCIANVLGNGYYTAIFLSLINSDIYIASNNGGGTYLDVMWVKK